MFKKLAIASAISALAAGAAIASPVTVYGVLDTAVRYDSDADTAGANRTRMINGGQSTSRLGFRGSEALGNGITANFVIEGGFNVNSGTQSQNGSTGTVLFDRFAYVGLASKDLGEIQVGRNTNAGNDLLVQGIVDPLRGALDGVGAPVNVTSGSAIRVNQAIYGVASTGGLHNSRSDGMIKYINQFGPVGVRAGYSAGGVAGDADQKSSHNFGVTLKQGSFNAGVSTLKATDAADKEMTNLSYGANFTVKAFTFTAAKHTVKTDAGYVAATLTTTATYAGPALGTTATTGPSTQADIVALGARYQITPNLASTLAYYDGDYKNGTGSAGDYKSYVLFNQYNLSKRTNFFASVDYGKTTGALAPANDTNTGYMVGVRHTF